jgi:hypothetical protein
MPERPCETASQFFATPVPSGVTKPTPVTATRRRSCWLLSTIAGEVVEAFHGRASKF